MGVIDFILNATGLLLWLNWRATRSMRLPRPGGTSLLGTLRRADPPGAKRWLSLIALALLLVIRALVYWWIGHRAGWIPKLPLNVIALSFRSDLLERMLLYSFLSFGLALTAFFLWLMLLSVVNRSVSDTDVWQKMVRLQLGWIERCPLTVKLLLPLCAVILVWLALTPVFKRLGIIPPPSSGREMWQQGLILGLAAYLLWKYLIGAVLLLYVVNSHVYLGTNPFWNYVDVTAHNLLAPLRGVPLRLGKVNFAPLIVVALVFFIDQCGSHALATLYHRLPI